MTMAMQRASPTTMRPVRYAERSGRRVQASANIRAGPMTQFRKSELNSRRLSPVTASRRS